MDVMNHDDGVHRDNTHIEDLLETMYKEQCDHLCNKFTDAYTKYREVVAAWMIDVTEYLNLHISTTHAAVAYLDRLQPNEQFSRFEWQMLAICCILISSKFHECEEHVPQLRKLEDITQQTITNDCVLSYELWALKKMSWKLNAFLCSYMKLGHVYDDSMTEEDKEELGKTMFALSTRCLVQTEFKSIPASLLAACIVYYARRNSGVSNAWTEEMTVVMFHDPTREGLKVLEMLYSLDEKDACFEELLCTLQDSFRSPAPKRKDQLEQENSFDEESEEIDEDVVCSGLQRIVLAELQSPPVCAKTRDEEPSPTSIAGMVL